MDCFKKTLSIFALGRLHEIEKNGYVIRYADEILIVDYGVKLAGESLLGVDLILLDFTFYRKTNMKLKASL